MKIFLVITAVFAGVIGAAMFKDLTDTPQEHAAALARLAAMDSKPVKTVEVVAPPVTPPADAAPSAEDTYAHCAAGIHNEYFSRDSIYDFDWEPAGITARYVSIDVRGPNAFGVTVTNRFRCPA